MAPTRVRHFISQVMVRSLGREDAFAGSLATRTIIVTRDSTSTVNSHNGVTDPKHINNNAMFAFFGILGAAICVTMIWFFFWAKNGGFYFGKNDWDDYKTTVLRRRGPNGTILSNATPSTNLGGGSIYKDVDDGRTEDSTTVVSGTTGLTGITCGVSDVAGREKHRKKRQQREREKERERERRRENKSRDKSKKESSRRKVNEDGILVDEQAEAEAKAHLRNYRNEKAARVGGLNKASDSSAWDGSTNPSASTAATESTVTSELIQNRERTPTSTPTKKQRGIRKVYSTADRNEMREKERNRAEHRLLQERAHASGGSSHRDFSWKYGEEASSRSDNAGSQVASALAESTVDSDQGTKSYHHIIPGLSSTGRDTESDDIGYQHYEEKRKQRQRNSGYRRD